MNTTTQPAPRCYRIVRCYADNRPSRTIKTGLTETEAKAHCSNPKTRKPGVYFDAFDYMKGTAP